MNSICFPIYGKSRYTLHKQSSKVVLDILKKIQGIQRKTNAMKFAFSRVANRVKECYEEFR